MSAVEGSELAAVLDLLWRCDLCGHQSWMATHPDRCNGCGTAPAPMTGRTMVEWRTLHVMDPARRVNEEPGVPEPPPAEPTMDFAARG